MRCGILSIAILLATGSVWAGNPALERPGLDFYESKIRPVLVKNCYECHAADSRKLSGGLLIDSRQGLLKGGKSGPAVVPGDLKESVLISALKSPTPEQIAQFVNDKSLKAYENLVDSLLASPHVGDATGLMCRVSRSRCRCVEWA